MLHGLCVSTVRPLAGISLRFRKVRGYPYISFMNRSARLIVVFGGLFTFVLLGWGLFFRSGGEIPMSPVVMTFATPADELEYLVTDPVDYRVSFSRMLVEKRIARARSLVQEDPSCAAKSAMVIDTLHARLQRSTPHAH